MRLRGNFFFHAPTIAPIVTMPISQKPVLMANRA